MITAFINKPISRINWKLQNIRLRKILSAALISTMVVIIGPAVDLITAPAANAAGSGLNFYWKNETGPTANITRTEFTSGTCATATSWINYAWSTGAQGSCNVDGFTTYATGFISAFNTSEVTYNFCAQADDGFYLLINGAVVINNWIDQGAATGQGCNSTGDFTFAANSVYTIKAWQHENGGGADMRLLWRIKTVQNNGTYEIVPTANLATSSALLTPSISIASTITNYDFGNTGYSYGVSASAGTAPYTYSLVAGTLPSSLYLDTVNGAIKYNASGAAASPGTFSGLQVRATDAKGMSIISSAFQVSVVKGAQPDAVSVSTLTGTYPSATLSASGGNGTGAYSYGLVGAGTAGCSITSNTISATSSGTCTFTATRATDVNYLAKTSSTQTFTFSTRAGINVKANSLDVNFGSTFTPTVAVLNLPPSDTATASSVTYTYVGINGTSYSSSTTKPTLVGSYSLTPSAATLTFSSGYASGYSATTYSSDTLTIIATVPGLPTTVVATANSSSSASISFTAPTFTGGSTITSYVVSNGTNATTASTATSPITVTGLSPGTAYIFRVNAVNAVGRSETASATSVTMPLQVEIAPPATTVTYGNPITNIVPTVTGGSTVTYSVSPSLPTGISLNTSTGVISGTPTVTSPLTTYTETATSSGITGANTFTLQVIKATSSVSAPAVSPASPTFGSALTFSATVTSNTAALLTGTVVFKNASNSTLCTTGTLSFGSASCSYIPTSTDTFTVRSYYSGMTYVDTATSTAALTVVPAKANPVFTLTGASYVIAGTSTQIASTVTPVQGTNPAGSVEFKFDGVVIPGCASVSITSNTAGCVFTPTSSGTFSIGSTYSGDANYNSVIATSINQTISSCTQSTTGLTLGTGAPVAGYCAVRITAGTSGSYGLPVGVVTMKTKIMIIGGGGSGGTRHGGGGGAGSLLYSDAFTVSETVTVTVGAGGAATNVAVTSGSNSGKATVFGAITAAGGGAGGGLSVGNGLTGGSGGGGAATNSGSNGLQTSYSAFSAYVNAGGTGTGNGGQTVYTGGGGGGAGGPGGNSSSSGPVAGKGGNGRIYDMTLDGSNACFAAGGAGGAYDTGPGVGGGCTGLVTATIGGAGNSYAQAAGPGTANTGSGGGGGGFELGTNYNSGAGGSGLVALRYISPATITVPIDSSTASNALVTFTAVVPTFTGLTRTLQWQTYNTVSSLWVNETSTALTYTFTARYAGVTSQRYRLLVTDSDGTLQTTTASRTIVLTVTPLVQATLSVASTFGFAGANIIMFTAGGNGIGAVTYSYVAQGSTIGCTLTGASLYLATTGSCKVVATKAADIDYLIKVSETATITFVAFQISSQIAPTNTETGISTSSTTTLTKGADSCTTGCVPTISSISAFTGQIGQTIVITISGTNFTGATAVMFNAATPAAAFTVVSSTQISATFPSGLPAGEVGIDVRTPGGITPRNFDFELLP